MRWRICWGAEALRDRGLSAKACQRCRLLWASFRRVSKSRASYLLFTGPGPASSAGTNTAWLHPCTQQCWHLFIHQRNDWEFFIYQHLFHIFPKLIHYLCGRITNKKFVHNQLDPNYSCMPIVTLASCEVLNASTSRLFTAINKTSSSLTVINKTSWLFTIINISQYRIIFVC